MASRRTPSSESKSRPAEPKPRAKTPAAAPEPATVPPTATATGAAPKAKNPPVAKPREKRAPAARPLVTPDMRRGMIAKAAYLRAERRGFAPGHEEEDWLAAETEVDKLLSADARAPQ